MDTEQLIQGCLKKETLAQRMFVERYGKKVMMVCHRYATQTVESNDIFQEAFIQIFAVLDQFDSSKGALEGWLYRVSVNKALKLIRKNLRYDQSADIDDHINRDDLKTEMNDSLGYKELLGFIQQLPEMQRMIFNLKVIEGYDHTEIAEQLGISSANSRSHLSRAKNKIKAMHLAYNNE